MSHLASFPAGHDLAHCSLRGYPVKGIDEGLIKGLFSTRESVILGGDGIQPSKQLVATKELPRARGRQKVIAARLDDCTAHGSQLRDPRIRLKLRVPGPGRRGGVI